MMLSTRLLGFTGVAATTLLNLLSPASAQLFVPLPQDITEVLSKNYPGASITYKENAICETTSGVRSWSGYVHLPSSLISDASYDQSLFFWYFESRQNSTHAPTTIYIPGGPGTSFLDGGSAFPCTVNPDSNSTSLNPWSFNRAANMLYVDSPVQTGYSYVKPQNGTVDLLTGAFTPVALGDKPTTNLTTVQATWSSQDPADTQNTTQQVARLMWAFSQVWFQEFPEYKTENKGLNVWGFSYSGFFAPATFAYFQHQNEKIQNGSIADKQAKSLPLDTIGINNGCVDAESQVASYLDFAHNNTYGVEVIDKEVYEAARRNSTAPGDCMDMIKLCRTEAAASDPQGLGTNSTVNQICVAATALCYVNLQGLYNVYSMRSPFDLALTLPATFPPEYPIAFYNQRWVQEALGVPVNYTFAPAAPVQNFFAATGDPFRYNGKTDLEYLASTGVNIALVYGDRDYRCNWMGVENVSLLMEYPAAPSFRGAGYTAIETNASYTGGLVRQFANVSFSRIFEAGHAVAAYQPESVFRVFERAVNRRDIATGQVDIRVMEDYSTSGPGTSLATRNILPAGHPSVCYLYALGSTCTPDELAALENGTAVVKDYVVTVPSVAANGTSGGGNASNTGSGPGGAISHNRAGKALPSIAGATGLLLLVHGLL